MTEGQMPKVRRNLFRAVALERYRGPIETDTPHTLPPRYPGFVVAAAVIGLGIGLLWL